MRFSGVCVGVGLLLSVAAAQADEVFEITGLDNVDGNPGFVMEITEDGAPEDDFFLFEEDGKVRLYAIRSAGSPDWDVLDGAQYVCPTTAMSIGQSWRWADQEGGPTTATVAAQEAITVGAGSFTAYRVDIALDSAPGTVLASIW